VTNRDNDDFSATLVEDHTPIADPEPRAGSGLEATDVSAPRRRKFSKTLVNPTADFGGKLRPLPRRCRRERDRPHA
jgi:hypothetical protein